MKNIKSQRGSITLLVVITVLFFIIITVSVYLANSNTRVSQMQEIDRIKEVYEADIENADMIYQDKVEIEGADGSWNTEKKVNSPKLQATGLQAVTIGTEGDLLTVTDGTQNWYSYTTTDKRWANAKTADGSMWVWIPRYAYRINSDQSIDIKFLQGTSNLDSDGIEVTGQGYIVHPCFQNGTANQFANGEWNKEVEGIWVAKFAAGFAEGNNSVSKVSSGITYSGTYASKNNIYGSIVSGTTPMYYPVFLPNTYAYNNINIGDIYELSKNLTKEGNPYGLEADKISSHQMKNSEWGAVAYLTQSAYGRNKEEVTINNVNLASSVSTVYGVTGYAGSSVSASINNTTIQALEAGTSGSYSWQTTQGQQASTTGNVYGIYDLSGCVWEYVAGYVKTTSGTSNLNAYGSKLANDGGDTSTKDKTLYAHNTSSDTYVNNYNQSPNPTRKGEAIWEVSTSGSGSTAWNGDSSTFMGVTNPFGTRGGYYGSTTTAGIFAFGTTNGNANSGYGFRAVLIPI